MVRYIGFIHTMYIVLKLVCFNKLRYLVKVGKGQERGRMKEASRDDKGPYLQAICQTHT
jgi:hypothetical protein